MRVSNLSPGMATQYARSNAKLVNVDCTFTDVSRFHPKLFKVIIVTCIYSLFEIKNDGLID